MNRFLLLFIITLSLFSHAQEFFYPETIIQDAIEATNEMQHSMSDIVDIMPLTEEEKLLPVTESIPMNGHSKIDTPLYNNHETPPTLVEKHTPLVTHESLDVESNKSDKNSTNEDEDENEGSSSAGGEIFKQHLKKYCHFTGEIFAKKYTQEEWEEIGAHGEFEETLYEICPRAKGHYNQEWTQDLYQFSYEYASDSDNIPEC